MLSVIIPVYNAEKYLNDCVDSVLQGDYSDLEVLLVDDGSLDKSAEICEQYAKKDSRVRVEHQKNKGVSNARNRGLELANGEYVTFVDADDIVEKDCFVNAMYLLGKNDADICCTPVMMSERMGGGLSRLDTTFKRICIQVKILMDFVESMYFGEDWDVCGGKFIDIL